MNFDTREWLVTNGVGGFASSTVSGCNTRRYHALFCPATAPPLGRMVLVNKADETISVNGRHFELGCNQYPGTIHPAGYQHLREFRLDPLPRWIYEVAGSKIQKTVWMPHGENRTVVRYELLEGGDATLAVRPFVTGRDYHGTHRYNCDFNAEIERDETHVRLAPYSTCPPIIWSSDGDFHPGGAWYYSFEYAIERERGLDFTEDAYCPGAWVWKLSKGQSAHFVIALENSDLKLAVASHEIEIARLNELQQSVTSRPANQFAAGDNTKSALADSEPVGAGRLSAGEDAVSTAVETFTARLSLAADQFIVRREDGLHTILAGYPWFSDWGRDTMIALPGLCLTTRRFDLARSILLAFAGSMSQGMIPNRFPDAGDTPDYNTVDATLWFFHAVARYVETSGDSAILDTLYQPLCDSIDWHLRGTRYGIVADASDGMLVSGEAGTQLTWMDAKVGDWVVTPRKGKPVEIQALWFNALKTMMHFAETRGDEATKMLCGEWSRKIKANFAGAFWNESEGALYDTIDGDFKDGAIRPNQIFAVSLPHRLLSAEQEKRVVATVQRELLTPYGLRSLSPRDSRYHGIYIGDQTARDGAYHQGTVWGWLIGPFLSAYLRVNRNSKAARAQTIEWLQPLHAHLDEAGLGSISEIFDGDAPHTPRGCFAQAWSVAEPLRVLGELQ